MRKLFFLLLALSFTACSKNIIVVENSLLKTVQVSVLVKEEEKVISVKKSLPYWVKNKSCSYLGQKMGSLSLSARKVARGGSQDREVITVTREYRINYSTKEKNYLSPIMVKSEELTLSETVCG